ncbi:hypothetical protein GCM10017653_07640 [Ancylobacter defluvii]|uniref:histidine kinase n=1 Tax=Ancylobacter defluvii TaxID=1282440 RepID=A0A9W6JRV8_9HYPH|nr:PAS domain-containing protein [Ancylobacter defluvii]GLK82695.1 hypothetical protein GCM10017653_07640 [Ancylobacter defluvii]
MLGAGLAVSALAGISRAAGLGDPALTWAAFFVLGLCIRAMVAEGTAVSADDEASAVRVLPLAGEETPAATRATIAGEAAAAGPSLSLIHSEDRELAAHAAARAFWTGVPQVVRYRQLQADGNYRWIETRSEPDYSISVDIDDVITDRQPPAWAAEPDGDHDRDVMQAAKIIESLFGNGWAFDAEGRWIYLHPFAQNSLGVTLDDLNASLKEGHTAWKRLLHPEDYEPIAAAWRHCLRTGDHFNVEFRFRRASGAYVWARTRRGRAVTARGVSPDGSVSPSISTSTRRPSRRSAIGSASFRNWSTWCPAISGG